MSNLFSLSVERDERGATISTDGVYRYRLWRAWSDEPRAVFVMLNPSTADANLDDPTIRRCIAFAKRLDCGGIEVVNLFALRSPYPKALLKAADPIGADNNAAIYSVITEARYVIAAWGAWVDQFRHGSWPHWRRADEVAKIIRDGGKPVGCLGVTKNGSPRHPLYVAAAQPIRPWTPSR